MRLTRFQKMIWAAAFANRMESLKLINGNCDNDLRNAATAAMVATRTVGLVSSNKLVERVELAYKDCKNTISILDSITDTDT